MKILLVGEYSRLHNSLKEGLIKLGHHVEILGMGDGFKQYPVDHLIVKKFDKGLLKKFKILLYLLTGFDLSSYITFRQIKKHSKSLATYDVIQFVNECVFQTQPYWEKKIIKHLTTHGGKIFLLSCGTDYKQVTYNFNHPELKSIVTPFFENKIKAKDFESVTKYKTEKFKNLHEYIYGIVDGIIATDLDYTAAYMGDPKYCGLIPNPINVDTITYKPLDFRTKIKIFHGINRSNYFRKGNDLFEKALEYLPQSNAIVEIIKVENLPYKEYIRCYDAAHILLDQVYANDQGYNALEAMAQGKIVFGGAEQIFMETYKLQNRVLINAAQNPLEIFEEIQNLVSNKEEMERMSKAARAFIETEHHYVKIAEKYVSTWNKQL